MKEELQQQQQNIQQHLVLTGKQQLRHPVEEKLVTQNLQRLCSNECRTIFFFRFDAIYRPNSFD